MKLTRPNHMTLILELGYWMNFVALIYKGHGPVYVCSFVLDNVIIICTD